MNKKMRRYKGLILSCISVMMLVVSIFSFSFESKASASGEYYVPYSEPTANDKSGYFNVDAGDGVLYTYFWNLTGSWATAGTPPACEMYVRFSGNNIIFHPYVYGGTGSTYITFGYYDSSGTIHFLYYGAIGLNDYEIIQNFWAGVKGVSFGGNCSIGAQDLSLGTPLIHWNDSVDAQNLNTKLNAILNSLSNIDGDTSTIINKLQDIYNQDVSINSKLSAMNTLLNEIKSEQKQTNTWLEKIWNSIQEILNPNEESKEESDKLESETNDKTDKLDDLNEQNKTDKTDIDSAANSVDENIDLDSIDHYGKVLSVITENQYILQILLLVFSVALVAYVLFGKK